MEAPQKIKIQLPYEPAILLMDIYPKEMKSLSQKDICTLLSTAALLLITTVKTWKQAKCPSTDGWIKKVWFIYKMEYWL